MRPATTPPAPVPSAAPPAGMSWVPLHRAGGVAALASAVLIPIQVAVFLVWPPPLAGDAADWFALLRERRLVGLVDLDLLLVLDNALLVPLLLALYVLLRRTRPSAMLLAAAAGLTSAVLYVVTNPAVAMASLGDRYSAPGASATARTAALSAGEVLLATWQGTAFHAGYLLGSAAGITIGVVMLRSGAFGRPAGYLGVLANAVGLGLYLPGVGVYVSVFSVLFLEGWYLLVARQLLRRRVVTAAR